MKHWPILIIFGVWQQEKTWRKWPSFCLSHLNNCCCSTLWKEKVDNDNS